MRGTPEAGSAGPSSCTSSAGELERTPPTTVASASCPSWRSWEPSRTGTGRPGMISRRSRSQEVSACNQVYFNLKFQASEIGFSRYTYGIIETELDQTFILCLIAVVYGMSVSIIWTIFTNVFLSGFTIHRPPMLSRSFPALKGPASLPERPDILNNSGKSI